MSQFEELRRSEWLTSLAGNLIVAGMVACVSAVIVNLLISFYPEWRGGYLVPLGGLVAVEAIHIHKARESVNFPEPEWFGFYFIEWLGLIVLVKALEYTRYGGLMADIPRYRLDFIGTWMSLEFVIGLIGVVMSWFVSQMFAAHLIHLQNDARLLQIEEDTGEYIDRRMVRRNLANLVVIIGASLVAINSLLRLNFEQQWFEMPAVRAGGSAILVYFGLGLTLLSLTQLTILRIRWGRRKIPMQAELTQRWIWYAGAGLTGLVLLALLLPTGYTIGLLRSANVILSLLLALVGLLFWLFSLPLLLLSWLLAMVSGNEPPLKSPPPSLPPEIGAAATPSGASVQLFEVLRSLLFWGLFLAMVVYFGRVYWLARRDQFGKIKNLPVMRWLGSILEKVWTLFCSVGKQVRAGLHAGLQVGLARVSRGTRTLPGVERYLHLGRMNPRERIFFYYQALLRRAGESGVERKPTQTPYEYEREIREHLMRSIEPDPDQQHGEAELHGITERFTEARYSDHEIELEQAGWVHQAWTRLRKALRRKERMDVD